MLSNISENMQVAFKQLKARAMSTEVAAWKKVVSATFLAVCCVGMVAAFWYIYLSMPEFGCYNGFAILSLIWLVVELMLIGYLAVSNVMPRLVRDLVGMLIGVSNIWFGLFIFSLKACS